MFGWLIRILLVIAGLITSLFVERDALNFGTIQMTVATILFALIVMLAAFWPYFKKQFKQLVAYFKKNN